MAKFSDFISTAANNVIGGFIGNQSNLSTMKAQNDFNAKEAEKSRQWQSSESQKNRDFSLDMWNRSNDYNSAAAQRKRLEEAGLNPFQLGGESAVSQPAQAQSAGAGASAFGASPPYSPMSGGLGMFREITGAIKDLASSGLDKASTKSVLDMLPLELQNLMADADLKKINTAMQSVLVDFAPKQQKALLDKFYSEINKFNSETELNKERVGEIVANISRLLASANVDNAKASEINKFVKDFASKKWQAEIDRDNAISNNQNEQAKTEPSKRELNKSATAHNYALTTSEDELREPRKRVLFSEETRNYSDSGRSTAEADTEVELRPYRKTRLANNSAPDSDYQVTYSVAKRITGSDDAAYAAQGILLALREGRETVDTATKALERVFSSLGVANPAKAASSVISRTFTFTSTE